MRSAERATNHNTLKRLGHVEPGAAQRGIEGEDPLAAQPLDEGGALVPGKVIQDQYET